MEHPLPPYVCGAVALYFGQDLKLSLSAVSPKLLVDSITNANLNTGSEIPNRMLVVGDSGKR